MDCPTPGVACHMHNTPAEDLVYLVGGENLDLEISDFPRLGRRMIRRGQEVEIYDTSAALSFLPAQS